MTDKKHNMKRIDLKDAKANFEQVFEDFLPCGEPVQIMKERVNSTLVSEENWRGMAETLSLLSIPGV